LISKVAESWNGSNYNAGVNRVAKGDELVKYVTEQLLTYIEMPRDLRKQAKAAQKEARESWQYRWFGMLPVAIRMWMEGLRLKK
jgi:hypothetical protein